MDYPVNSRVANTGGVDPDPTLEKNPDPTLEKTRIRPLRKKRIRNRPSENNPDTDPT